MRDSILKSHSATVELVKGHGGVFDIITDGQLKFSKKQSGRFPTDQDIDNLFVDQ